MSNQSDSNQSFVGQLNFTAVNSPYNRLVTLFKNLAGRMATVTLVQVTAVHPGSGLLQGTVDAQLLINQQDALGNITPHGIIYGLPYERVQAGACALIIDPAVNDIGVAVFASRDISAVVKNQAQSNPGSFRRFDYADGIYLFTALSSTQPTDYAQILPAGGINLADRFGNSIVMANGGITINGIFFPTGGISFDIKTHTHNQPNDSHGDTEMPTNHPNDGS